MYQLPPQEITSSQQFQQQPSGWRQQQHMMYQLPAQEISNARHIQQQPSGWRQQQAGYSDVEQESVISSDEEDSAMFMCCGGDQDVHILQMSLKNPLMPNEIRLDFIRKVYGILFAMLCVSFGIVLPFVVRTDQSMQFMAQHKWITTICLSLLLLQQFMNITMFACACCDGGQCLRRYIKMFTIVPLNFVYLFTYAACFGVLLGVICASYEATSVGLVFALTAGMMIILSIYACCTDTDFTGCGMYIVAMLMGLLFFMIIGIFFPDTLYHKIVSAVAVVLFSFIIIHDTQLIVGTAKFNFCGSAAGALEFSIDMYAFAAFQLYLDFINLFLNLLKLLGRRN